jgi:hypothetical protein
MSNRQTQSTRNVLLWLICELGVAANAMCFVGPANAAEIIWAGGTIVLEGKIEQGDYDKLRDHLLVERGYDVSHPGCLAIYEDGCPEEMSRRQCKSAA